LIIIFKANDQSVEERLDYLEEISKVKVLRSCDELAAHGVSKSDFYEIDPDGELIGSPPITVYCNFNTGATEVIHDSESMLKVEHCGEVGCYKHDVQYLAPMNQIQALIQLSDSCSQSFDFGCYLAPLTFDDINLGTWLDKNGNTLIIN
jgi:hypothetical protein